MDGVNEFHSELKYDNSNPTAVIGFERLAKFDMTPALTMALRIRPSHITAITCSSMSIDIQREKSR